MAAKRDVFGRDVKRSSASFRTKLTHFSVHFNFPAARLNFGSVACVREFRQNKTNQLSGEQLSVMAHTSPPIHINHTRIRRENILRREKMWNSIVRLSGEVAMVNERIQVMFSARVREPRSECETLSVRMHCQTTFTGKARNVSRKEKMMIRRLLGLNARLVPHNSFLGSVSTLSPCLSALLFCVRYQPKRWQR